MYLVGVKAVAGLKYIYPFSTTVPVTVMSVSLAFSLISYDHSPGSDALKSVLTTTVALSYRAVVLVFVAAYYHGMLT